jgi:hypothetical protein
MGGIDENHSEKTTSDDAEEKPDRPAWEFSTAVLRLDDTLKKLATKWPAEERSSMAAELRRIANEVEAM